jgi:transposase
MESQDGREHLRYDVARHKQQGRSNRAIALILGINRRTVARLLLELQRRRDEGQTVIERELPPARVPRGSVLDRYDARIRGWLKEYPELTAERCFEKLGELGFTGGRTVVQDRVRAIRQELVPAEPAAVMSYAPGQRGEFDGSPYRVGLEGELKVQVWNAVLSWSRYATPQARDNTRQTTILECLSRSLALWGGVPQELLTDTMPGVVDRWECDQPILNARFVDYAAHYDVLVKIAPRRCPKYKARTERRFWFIEQNALNGRRFETIPGLDEYFGVWVRDQVLGRTHPERAETIGQILAEERLHLRPLPAHPYDTRDVVAHVVSATGHVHFQTHQYPVPGATPGERVYVCADAGRIVVCNLSARRLVEHEWLPDGAKIQLAQLPGMRRPRGGTDQLVDPLAQWHEDAAAFARAVRERSRQAAAQLARLLMLQGQWNREDVLSAMRLRRGDRPPEPHSDVDDVAPDPEETDE